MPKRQLLEVLSDAARTRVLQALAVVLLLNAALLWLNPLSGVDPQRLPLEKTWSWWAVHDFISEAKKPDVVLLGSSLLMNPVWQNEADFSNANLDIVVNRRTRYLESALGQRLGVPSAPICFNFALPGAFVSDDYMILRTMLSGPHHPKVVIMGLSPRDFIENGLRGAAFSPHFRYLKRFTPIDDIVDVSMPHVWQRAGYVADNHLFFLGKKLELQCLTAQFFTNLTNAMHKPVELKCAEQAAPAQDVGKAIYETELRQGVWLAHPHQTPPFYEGEVAEFKRRYKDSKRIDNQLRWLEMALTLCRDQDIKVVMLNMPVTQTNLTVYPPGVYDSCVAAIAAEAKKFGCSYVDLQATQAFPQSDFSDMWHMNAHGGKQLLDIVADDIAQDQTLASVLYSSRKPVGIAKRLTADSANR